jgi:16S rRNA (cytidine1402-2'-O)-methyltransferase
MASGLNGQSFVFHGYLPVAAAARDSALHRLEEDSARTGRSQLFIETPYRNEALLEAILACCRAESRLCVALDLSLPTEAISTKTIAQWQGSSRSGLQRRPAMFVLQAAGPGPKPAGKNKGALPGRAP